MTNSRNQDDSARLSTALAAEGNPYLQSVLNEQPKAQTDGGSEVDSEAQQEEAFHRADEEKKRKRRRHRRIAIALILMLLSAVAGFALMLYRPHSTTVEYRQETKQPGVLPPRPNETTTRDNRHEQAILEVQRLNKTWQAQNAQQQAATAGTNPQKLGNDSGAQTTGESQQPFIIPASSSATHNSSSSEKDSSTTSSVPRPNDPRSLRSQRNSETSLYVGEGSNERGQPTPRSLEGAMTKALAPKNESTAMAVVAPPFGSILPVRAIGGLYTLRSGALARFELTRDMFGNGWSMKRGTILVGNTKGGEYDRAYVSIVGFIDSQSGKLVKLGGDVLGGDRAAGLKGKSKQLDSRWTRVLGEIGNAALNLTGAILGGRSNGTVIISDGARSPLINPISDELSGVLGSPSDRNRRTSFVEIVAGTPGYVMVTDLPAEIKATDANELNEQSLATLADIDSIRPATGMSEREFADLLANGSLDEIKARLHRMSTEMRKIALAVVER